MKFQFRLLLILTFVAIFSLTFFFKDSEKSVIITSEGTSNKLDLEKQIGLKLAVVIFNHVKQLMITKIQISLYI
jgi:hypothetical protein